jgi:hypothetical protein
VNYYDKCELMLWSQMHHQSTVVDYSFPAYLWNSVSIVQSYSEITPVIMCANWRQSCKMCIPLQWILFWRNKLIMKCSIFWDITLYSLLKGSRRFGGTCRHHLQGRRVSHAGNQRETGSKQSQPTLSLTRQSPYKAIAFRRSNKRGL